MLVGSIVIGSRNAEQIDFCLRADDGAVYDMCYKSVFIWKLRIMQPVCNCSVGCFKLIKISCCSAACGNDKLIGQHGDIFICNIFLFFRLCFRIIEIFYIFRYRSAAFILDLDRRFMIINQNFLVVMYGNGIKVKASCRSCVVCHHGRYRRKYRH